MACLVAGGTDVPVFAHYMPWFETPESNLEAPGQWGYHWTLQNRNPNIILPNGQRDIASHFYPLIEPYASSDPDVIEYHLLLMKTAGIDGIIITHRYIEDILMYQNDEFRTCARDGYI